MDERTKMILSLVESSNQNIFITGKAGTGKTMLLRQIKTTSKRNLVVVAYTAAAALNAGGVTISSFFQVPRGPLMTNQDGSEDMLLRLSPDKLKLLRSLEVVVIDEISMVRADMMDYLDQLLKQVNFSDLPFGGVQILAFGDLYQLPPVASTDWSILSQYYKSPYFFSSRSVMENPFIRIELEHVYRQTDPLFLEILNGIRANDINDELLGILNLRHLKGTLPEDHITVTTHNRLVDKTNTDRLEALEGNLFVYDAIIKGDYPKEYYPCENQLKLKVGAMIIMAKNDTSGNQQFYNGRAGIVCHLGKAQIRVRFSDDLSELDVMPETWQHTQYEFSKLEGKVQESALGTFIQYPIKLAWAITVHKSQGLTFDKVIVDVGSSFTHGQAYVGLSRCRTMEGLVLNSPVTRTSLLTDQSVVDYMGMKISSDRSPVISATDHIFLRSQFLFPKLFKQFVQLEKRFPDFLSVHKNLVMTEIIGSSQKFIQREISRLDIQLPPLDHDGLKSRLSASASYMLPRLEKVARVLYDMVETIPDSIDITDNCLISINEILLEISLRRTFFEYIETWKFMEVRNAIRRTLLEFAEAKKAPNAELLVNPELFAKLCEWRTGYSIEKGVPEYIVMSDKTLRSLAEKAPRSLEALATVGGIGPAKSKSIGVGLLKIIQGHFGAHELF